VAATDEVDHRQHPQLGDQELEAGGNAHPRKLLGNDRLVDQRRAAAAVLLGIAQRGELHRLQRFERLPRVLGGTVDVAGQRSDLCSHELATTERNWRCSSDNVIGRDIGCDIAPS